MIDNTEKRVEAGKAADAGKAAAKGAANAAEGQAKAAAGKLASAFSDLKGDAAALLKGLKDSLGIPDLPKFPKKPAFKELKKFKPKTHLDRLHQKEIYHIDMNGMVSVYLLCYLWVREKQMGLVHLLLKVVKLPKKGLLNYSYKVIKEKFQI